LPKQNPSFDIHLYLRKTIGVNLGGLLKNIKQHKNRILSHVAFWLFFLAFYTFIFGYPDHYLFILKGNLLSLPIDMMAVYFTIYFLLPKYLVKRKYFLFSIWFIVSATIFVLTERAFAYFIVYADINRHLDFFNIRIFSWFVYIYVFVFFALFIKISKTWYINYKKSSRLEKEKLETELRLKEAELKLLKAQNHPHFLFNTLNNLYGLTLEKSDNAPEVVLKLSALLDYMLYECNSPEVLLKKEIDHIKNYIALEQLRYDDSLKLELKIMGGINHQKIAPLLLLPFVENSFKHGASDDPNNSWIKIHLNVSDSNLDFEISNSKSCQQGPGLSSYSEGIGLKNVKKRIELAYQGNYELKIEDKETVFSVKLKLNLEKH
jgi:two-component system, LytTR family, sensor kinase